MVPPPPPPHHLYAKANTSSSIFLHWRRPAFTTAQMINYTIRCNPVGLQNASLVLYLQTYVTSINGCFLCSPPHSQFLLYHLGPAWASAVSICPRTYFMYTVVGDFIFTYSMLRTTFFEIEAVVLKFCSSRLRATRGAGCESRKVLGLQVHWWTSECWRTQALKGADAWSRPKSGLGATEAPDRTEPVLIWLIKTQGDLGTSHISIFPWNANNVTSESWTHPD